MKYFLTHLIFIASALFLAVNKLFMILYYVKKIILLTNKLYYLLIFFYILFYQLSCILAQRYPEKVKALLLISPGIS